MTKEICLACGRRSFWEGPCSEECLARIIPSPDEAKKFSDYTVAVTMEVNPVLDLTIHDIDWVAGWSFKDV